MKKAVIFATAGVLCSFGIAGSALAATFQGPSGLSSLPMPVTNIITLSSGISSIWGWLFWGLMAISVIMFLVGGYRYATSAGDPEKVKHANKTLLYAAIAVIVGLFAAGMPILINSFLIGGSMSFFPW